MEDITVRLLDQLLAQRQTITDSQNEILTRAATDERDLDDAEDANLRDLAADAAKLDERIAQLRDIADANAKAAETRANITTRDDHEPAATGAPVRVGREPLTYERESGRSFFQDLYQAQLKNDPAAQMRMARHTQEMEIEQRDSAVANFAGLVVPQYLTDLAAEYLRAGRPFANACTRLELPGSGMTVNVSRLTTGSTTAIQASENASVSEATPDDTLLTVNVRTIAGQVDASRQLLERGTGVDDLLMMDLAAAYGTTLDSGIISDDGTSGTHLGVLSTSGIGDVDQDDASPTAAETYVQIVNAIGTVNANRFTNADLIVMHPRRFSYLAAGLDTTNRPLFQTGIATATNVIGTGPNGYGNTGANILGVPIVTDANIPTNLGTGTDEDRIIVAQRRDLLLWEEGDGSPRQVRVENGTAAANNSASLTVKLVAYGFSAFTAGRHPEGIAVIQGSLLAATL